MPLSVRDLVASQRIPRCYYRQPHHLMVLETCSRCWSTVLLFVVASVLSSTILRIRTTFVATLGFLFWLSVCEIGRHIDRTVRSTRSGGFKKGAHKEDRGSPRGEMFGICTFPSAAHRDNYVGLEINKTRPDRGDAVRSVDKAAQACVAIRLSPGSDGG